MINESPASRQTFARPTILRAIASIIADELKFQRGEDLGPTCGDWTLRTELAGPEIRADSLEIIGLSARLNQAFHLHETGDDAGLRTAPDLGHWAAAVDDALDRPDARVTFMTSGSTGEPRACTHPLARLDEEVAFLREHFADRRRIVAAVPAHHIYGFLFTVLLPAALDVAVVDARGRTGSEVRRMLRPGDLLISFPLGWEELARGPGDGPAPDVLGVTSTAPCDPAVIARARDAGFGPITEVYGSSETGGIGTRDDPDAPYTLMPHVSVERIRDQAMDQLEWCVDDPRRFHVRGRRDHAVQVGGINVHPDQVAETLRSHPSVADVAVRLMRPDEGRRLKAFVVPADPGDANDAEALHRELDAWCAEHLDAPSRPRAMRCGTAVPTTDTGKQADWDAFPSRRDAT